MKKRPEIKVPQNPVKEYRPVEPVINFVFGQQNADVLSRFGVPFTLLSKDPMVNWLNSPGPRDCTEKNGFGRLAWGLSLWRSKLECIKEALKTHEGVVWLDWDCHQMRPLPADFWEQLERGQPIQAQLRDYNNTVTPWRGAGKYTTCHGAFIYCRSMAILDEIIHLHATQFPRCTDERAIANWVDQRLCGWHGPEVYGMLSFAPSCFINRRTTIMPPLDRVVFVEGSRKTERRITKSEKRKARWIERQTLKAEKRKKPKERFFRQPPVVTGKTVIRFVRRQYLDGVLRSRGEFVSADPDDAKVLVASGAAVKIAAVRSQYSPQHGLPVREGPPQKAGRPIYLQPQG